MYWYCAATYVHVHVCIHAMCNISQFLFTRTLLMLTFFFFHITGSRAVKSQFMLGEGLLGTGVFQRVGEGESANAVAYFPPGCW